MDRESYMKLYIEIYNGFVELKREGKIDNTADISRATETVLGEMGKDRRTPPRGSRTGILASEPTLANMSRLGIVHRANITQTEASKLIDEETRRRGDNK